MESLEISVDKLADVNRNLRQFADLLHCESSLTVTPEQMASVLADIVRVGEWTGAGLPQYPDERFSVELACYRSLLEQLRQALPSLQARLLTERSRLQTERTHLDAAATWAQSVTSQSSSR